jgi:hypothetical protein
MFQELSGIRNCIYLKNMPPALGLANALLWEDGGG